MELDSGKLYYSIGEVAELLGENVSLIRFWSDNFPKHVKPRRTANKRNRIYTADDVRALQTIHFLVKEKGMTLEGAARRMDADKVSADRGSELMTRLKDIRDRLQEVYDSI